MESDRIEILLERYFDAETSIAEENELMAYFSSSDVAQHLEQYRSLFGYFEQEQHQKYEQALPLQTNKPKAVWLSIAASVVVLLGAGIMYFTTSKPVPQDLGTFDDPEIAFRETQKALNLLSQNVNVGVESVKYVGEYERSKQLIFKQ
ncbi:hypothetical protein [Flavobacterium kingsejongi]|uniref:Uncharacterized protein n=1 Tax=Flavobacterium kingsejongi TaxID=1678728 RepID=A0A2S1LTN1_9FLAO|nr:hypothetical protein [Flavobacterium kingsejongi]AWG27113.1 hypothetical protein FK004_18765 [Flavobacterium kingsejongi]